MCKSVGTNRIESWIKLAQCLLVTLLQCGLLGLCVTLLIIQVTASLLPASFLNPASSCMSRGTTGQGVPLRTSVKVQSIVKLPLSALPILPNTNELWENWKKEKGEF